MPKKIHGLDWLDDNNPEQLKWALEYLSDRNFDCDFPKHLALLYLKKLGQEIESKINGEKFLNRMNNSWRQIKSRSTDIRKTYSFKLLPMTRQNLKLLAKNNKKTSSDFIEQLIHNSTENFAILKKEINTAKRKLKIEQANAIKEIDQHKKTSELAIDLLKTSITDLCKMEILLRDAGIAIDSITDKQKLEAEEMAQAKTAKTNADIRKKHRNLSGFHSIKSPMDRPNSEAIYTPNTKNQKAKIRETTTSSESTGALHIKLETDKAAPPQTSLTPHTPPNPQELTTPTSPEQPKPEEGPCDPPTLAKEVYAASTNKPDSAPVFTSNEAASTRDDHPPQQSPSNTNLTVRPAMPVVIPSGKDISSNLATVQAGLYKK